MPELEKDRRPTEGLSDDHWVAPQAYGAHDHGACCPGCGSSDCDHTFDARVGIVTRPHGDSGYHVDVCACCGEEVV